MHVKDCGLVRTVGVGYWQIVHCECVRRSVKTGSTGIENKFSVFGQLTLELNS